MVSSCTNSRAARMLRTGVSATARAANRGQRPSAVRSSMSTSSSSRMASRHGPSSVSYWMRSTRAGTSSVGATVVTGPGRRTIEIDAWAQPGTVSTPARVIRACVSAGDCAASKLRAMSTNVAASSSSGSSSMGGK